MNWIAYAQTIDKQIFDNLAVAETPELAIAAAQSAGVQWPHSMAYCARRADVAAPDPLKRDKLWAALHARANESRMRQGNMGKRKGKTRYDFVFKRGHC